MTTKEQVVDYIRQIVSADSDRERLKAKNVLLKYYYFLPEVEKSVVEQEMEPFLEEIRLQFQDDPVLQRAEELLNRRRMSKAVL